jgi:propanol-preferring alcohol dehydrogenase
VAIVTASATEPYEQAFRSLRRCGTIVAVGAPKDNTVRLPIFQTIVQEVKVIGSFVGTRADLAETFQLRASGRTTVVKETGPLTQVNEAMTDVGRGSVQARLVFDLRC